MQELIFSVDTKNIDECLEVARCITNENLSVKDILTKYANKDFNTSAANEKEFLLKQLVKFFKILLEHSLSSSQVPKSNHEVDDNKHESNPDPELPKDDLKELPALPQDLHDKISSLESHLASLEEKCSALEQQNSMLVQSNHKLKYAAESSNEKEFQLSELRQKVRDLTSKIVELEPQYMMKVYERHMEIDQEVHGKMLKHISKWQRAATKIQASWKGRCARAQYLKQIQAHIQKLYIVKSTPDHVLLKKICQMLKKSRLTLEECYRAADLDSDGVVSCEEFSRFLSKLKLDLSSYELSRLIAILDDDMSGKLENQEFYETLAAYRVISDTSRVKGLSRQVLQRFLESVNSRDLDPESIFNSCDVNGDGRVSVEELGKLSKSMGMKKREILVLMEVLDSDHSGLITKEEFLRYFTVAEQSVFKVETVGSTSAMQMPRSIKAIVQLIESSGISISKALDMIQFPASGKVQISYITGAFSKLFPTVSPEDIKALFSSIDSSKTGHIQHKDLILFLHSYCEPSSFSHAQVLAYISSTLSKQNLSIRQALEQKNYPNTLDVSSFLKFTSESFNLNYEQGVEIFNEISAYSGRVTVADLEAKFEAAAEFNDESSPRTHAAGIVKEVLQALARFNLTTANIFRSADRANTGSVTAPEFATALQKFVPGLSGEIVKEFCSLLPANVGIRDLEVIAPEKKAAEVDQFGMREEEAYWVVLLSLSIKKLGCSCEVIFRDADKDQSGKIVMEEFKSALKRCIPGSMLTYTDICMIFKSFDRDSSGFIDEQEFKQRLAECTQSIFYESLSTRVQEQRGNYDMYKNPIKQKAAIDDFPIPPLPLSHIPKKSDYDKLLSHLSSSIPSDLKTHEFLLHYKLRLTSLISAKHISYIFRLNLHEASDLFLSLDLHSRGITYCFMLCTVLDSYRYSLQHFPIPHNPYADPHLLVILRRLLGNFRENPVFYGLPALETEVVWEKTTALPLEAHDVAVLKQNMPKVCYYYHIAAALLNSSVGVVISPVEVMYNAMEIARVKTQAADFFGNYSLHASDICERGEFLDRIGRILEISPVEADVLAVWVYKEQQSCSLHGFFTYFDMVLSTYAQGSVIFALPKLPFSTEKGVNATAKEFFKRLSGYLDKPLARYGLNINGLYTDTELSQYLEGFDSNKQELHTYLGLLKMNKFVKIRCYHLISVLQSYSEGGGIASPGIDLAIISSLVDKKTQGLSFLKQKEHTLDSTLVEEDVALMFPNMTRNHLKSVFNFIDNFSRGYIFGHQLATVIDLSHQTSDMRDFPLSGNPRINPKIKKILSENSIHLDMYHKTAMGFYTSNKIKPEESIDLVRFTHSFSSELTAKEAEAIFRSIDINREGVIKAYYYVSCIESFCRNTSSTTKVVTPSPLKDLFSIVLEIPEESSTISYFKDLAWHGLLTRDQFFRYLEKKFSVNLDSAQAIYQEIDKYDKRQIFVYQFFSYIDIYRSCVEEHRIAREACMLPYKWVEKDLQCDMNLKAFSEELDRSSRGSCDYFWSMGIDPIESVSVQEFMVTMADFNHQQAGKVFTALDITRQARVVMYHLLAVVETYRNKIIENHCKPVIRRKVEIHQKKSAISALSPLQEALNKLGRYIAGDNPKKKPLSSQEIFGMMDVNKDGKVSMNEFLDCMNLLPLGLSQNQIYLLLKEADLDGNGVIDYQEFSNFVLEFVKKPEFKNLTSAVVAKPQRKEILGLNRISHLPENSIQALIGKLKLYIQANIDVTSSIELIFGRIDYSNSLTMTHQEFCLALDRLNLGFTSNQKDLLVSLADKSRNHCISYPDFIQFIYDYNFEEIPKEPEQVTEDILNYVLHPSDFFTTYRETTTVMNSEKAALKRCFELLRATGPFVDPDFGPESSKNGAFCLYVKGKPPTASHAKPKELVWKRPEEIFKNSSFFRENISSNDVVQGSLGNCWFIGALSVLATRDELVRGSIQNLSAATQIDLSTVTGLLKGVYPPLFHCLARKGLYVLRFFKEFAWRYVIIDSRLPFFRSDEGKISYVFAHCTDPEELWVSLIEKAYAKLHGCYEALDRGLIDDGLVDLTGLAAEKTKLQGQSSEELWHKLTEYKESRSLIGCSIEGNEGEVEVVRDSEATGLLSRHAYAVVDVLFISNPNAVKRRHRLLRLRNPWGQREWTGKWSSKDPKLKENLKILEQEIQKLGSDEQFDLLNPNDGCFLMSFKDWRNLYSNIYTCVDFPDNWSGVRFQGEWTKTSSGGVPQTINKADWASWGANPQYVVEARKNCEIFVTLAQRDGRFGKGVFPYEKSLLYVCFAIMRLEPGENEIKQFDETRVFKLSKLKLHREVNLRTVLPAGRYAIVPATKISKQVGTFWLSVYFSCPKNKFSCTFKNSEGSAIAEEEEIPTSAVNPSLIKSYRTAFEKLSSI